MKPSRRVTSAAESTRFFGALRHAAQGERILVIQRKTLELLISCSAGRPFLLQRGSRCGLRSMFFPESLASF